MEVEIQLTSREDGSRFIGYFPAQSMTPIVEYLVLAYTLNHGATGELRARVEPAMVRGDDEVIAFAVYIEDRPETALGVINRDCELVTSAINDVWAEVVQTYGRSDSELADYRLVCTDLAREDVATAGIRVIGERPSAWRHAMMAPPVRPIALSEGAIVGKPTGAIARVFAASALQHLLDYLTEDLENERMAALHGELAITPTDSGLLPYVLYDAVSPLDGTATSHSVHVGAGAQGEASGRPVAAICHSHPAVIDPEAGDDEDELRWGLTIPSAVDLAQFRRGLPHVHQATIIASLPSEAGEPVPITPWGYSARFGRIESDRGFWIIADDALAAPARLADGEHDVRHERVHEGSVS